MRNTIKMRVFAGFIFFFFILFPVVAQNSTITFSAQKSVTQIESISLDKIVDYFFSVKEHAEPSLLEHFKMHLLSVSPQLLNIDYEEEYHKSICMVERNKRTIWSIAILLCIIILLQHWNWWRNRRITRLNQRIIDTLNIPVFWVDRKGCFLKRLNVTKPLGIVDVNELKEGDSVQNYFVNHNEYKKYIALLDKVFKTSKTQGFIAEVRDKQQQERYLYVRLVYSDVNRAMVFVDDATERGKEDRAVEEYQYFLESILENLPIPAFVRDVNDNGRYSIWNKRLAELTGVDASLVKGKSYSELAPEVQEVINSAIIGSKQASEVVTEMKEMKCLNGGFRLVTVHNSHISYKDSRHWLVGSIVDVTEREQRKLKIEMLNNQYDLLLRAIGAMPWTWDVASGQIECDRTYMSEKYGITKSLIWKTEKEHYNQIAPEYREKVRTAIMQLYSGETRIMNEQYPVYYSEYNSYLWVESYMVVEQRDILGKPSKYVGATIIIDDRKQLENALLAAKEKAEESNKLKSAFLANMSHEIRTPLNSIVGFSSVLSDMIHTPESEECIRIISDNTRLLLQLVNDVLDISKIESGIMDFDYNNVDINATLGSFVASWGMRMPEGVEISSESALDECTLYTVENRLLQVLNNFVSNAVKYTEKGTIKVGYYLPKDGVIRFYVKDTGVGIPADKQASVFERFVKLDRYKQGTGLGLSICKMIAENMKGHVGVMSEVGKGSEFWFEIPYQTV